MSGRFFIFYDTITASKNRGDYNDNWNYRSDSLLNQALEIALQNAGYYTISAHTRKEALDLLREKVDVFLIDIGLPDGNGIELYQELQMEKRIPAIFLTARDEEKENAAGI